MEVDISVLISDLVYYGSANMPEADSATTGGAIDFSKRVEFNGTAMTPTQFDVVSSSVSDTATLCQIKYRDSTGVVQTPAATTLTGQTKAVMTTVAAERLLAGVTTGGAIAGLTNPGGTAAVGDVAAMAHTLTITAHTMQTGSAQATTSAPPVAKLQSGDGASVSVGMVLRTTGGTGPNQIRRIIAINPSALGADVVAVNRNWAVVPDSTTTYEVAPGFVFDLTGSNGGAALSGTSTQTLAITRLFATATADVSGGSTRTFYEEIFVNNNNQTTALTVAQVLYEAISPALPTGATIDIALASALNDTATIANRQTAPTGLTSYTSGAPPQGINVPAPQNLAASASAGSATSSQKIVVRLTLLAGTAAYEGVPTFRTTGSST